MRTVPIWMPLHVSDYVRDTRHLSTLEHGAYILLLMTAWSNAGELPADEKRLARIAGLNPREWNRVRETLLDFFCLEGGMYRQKRIDHELQKASVMIDKKRAAGKASARARAKQALNRCSTGEPTEGATEAQQSANQSQSQGSVSKETGGGPPKDPAKEVFDKGVALLTTRGSSPGAARSLIGKWRKQAGDSTVSGLIDQAIAQNISDPAPWITAALTRAATTLPIFTPPSTAPSGAAATHDERN